MQHLAVVKVPDQAVSRHNSTQQLVTPLPPGVTAQIHNDASSGVHEGVLWPARTRPTISRQTLRNMTSDRVLNRGMSCRQAAPTAFKRITQPITLCILSHHADACCCCPLCRPAHLGGLLVPPATPRWAKSPINTLQLTMIIVISWFVRLLR